MFTIRVAGPDDAAVAAAIHLLTVTRAYAHIFPADASPPTLDQLTSQWVEELVQPGAAVWIAESGGLPAGTVVVRPHLLVAGLGELRRLHVVPDWWGRGLGSRLHDSALATMRERFTGATLRVLERNDRARSMYERRGWELVPGDILELGGGVREVRYDRPL
jgi:GNAT superfamily N-acetyltransferase